MIAVSDSLRQMAIDLGVDIDKVCVIPNGVDLSRFDDRPDPNRLRTELGLPAATPLVGSVGRISKVKGLEHFLEAAAMLAPRFPDARFLVVGQANADEHEYENLLKVRADQLGLTGRVIFTGLRSDVPAVMASLTVSVMPSLNEALSNSLLESMAAGVPLVATRVGGTTEAVVDGVSGLLVEAGDSEALADSIARLLDDPPLARRLGRAARNTIEEQFSIERMVQATKALYQDLLARKHSHVPFWSRRNLDHVLRRADYRAR